MTQQRQSTIKQKTINKTINLQYTTIKNSSQ